MASPTTLLLAQELSDLFESNGELLAGNSTPCGEEATQQQPAQPDQVAKYLDWYATVDENEGGEVPKSVNPPWVSRFLRPVNRLSSAAVIDLVERYFIPEGRVVPVKILRGSATPGTEKGWLSLFQFARQGGQTVDPSGASTSTAQPQEISDPAQAMFGLNEDEHESAMSGRKPSSYSQVKAPANSLALKELETYAKVLQDWWKSKTAEEKKELPFQPGNLTLSPLLNVAHIVWRYFHRQDNERVDIPPEKFEGLVAQNVGSITNTDILPEHKKCRLLPMGLQVSHAAAAYDEYSWKEEDVFPGYLESFRNRGKRKGKGRAATGELGSNPGYKVEVSECEDIIQQRARQTCEELALFWRSAQDGTVIPFQEAGSEVKTLCPHAAFGRPCYGPYPQAQMNKSTAAYRIANSNPTARSQLRERLGYGVKTEAGPQTRSALLIDSQTEEDRAGVGSGKAAGVLTPSRVTRSQVAQQREAATDAEAPSRGRGRGRGRGTGRGRKRPDPDSDAA